MTYPRGNHAAVLLPNGLVLVAGGRAPGATATAELYHPKTGQWTLTGSMSVARTTFPVALLGNQLVLVAGGGTGRCCDFPQLASAELYNPSTGTWSMTGSMNQAHGNEPGMLLHDGRVLVAGGYTSAALASAELYDPSTGMWTSAGSMSTARCCDEGTVLPNGSALVMGGHGTDNTPIASAELYTPAPPPPLAREGQNLVGTQRRD